MRIVYNMIYVFCALFAGVGVGAEIIDHGLLMVGSAVRAEGVVRIMMDKDNDLGGVQVLDSIELKSFELQVDLNIAAENHGTQIAFWFSQQTQNLGPIYGLSEQFKGFGAFLESNSSTLFITNINELTQANIKSGEKCQIDISKPISLHFYTEESTFEVWTSEISPTKCAEVIKK